MSCSCGAAAEIWPDLTNEGYEWKHDIIFLIIKLRGPKIQGITPFLFFIKMANIVVVKYAVHEPVFCSVLSSAGFSA